MGNYFACFVTLSCWRAILKLRALAESVASRNIRTFLRAWGICGMLQATDKEKKKIRSVNIKGQPCGCPFLSV